ncbi:MAG: rhodanese-like domain-containing protein [Methanospirillum sp.]
MIMTENGQCREASPEECRRVIEEERGCRVLDVRTPAEFREGHLENAVNIDFYAPDFKERLEKLEKDRPYVVYCKKGARGAKAMEILRQAGFSRVYNVSGGYDNWASRSLPVQR